MVEVGDADELYRRLAPDHVGDDGTVLSNAFKVKGKPDLRISVDLAKLTTPEQALASVEGRGFGLGMLPASLPRSLGFKVRHDPLPGNEAHALIEGENTKDKCRTLADGTRVLIKPQRPHSSERA